MYKPLKIILDRVGALLLLGLSAPVFLVVAILIRIKLGAPVIFKQERPGLNENIFTVYKFRTMKEAYDETGAPLPDGKRITVLGRLLRKLSLDELPQLLNVLKGDMSFVGPRPLLPSYLPYYTKREKLRHSVRPGITGLAQVTGRNSLSWDDRLELDAQYAENLSLALDLSILFRTVGKVLKGSDVIIIPGEKQGTLVQCRQTAKTV